MLRIAAAGRFDRHRPVTIPFLSEVDDRMARMVLSAGFVALALLGALGFYLAHEAAPSCDSEPALHAVTDILRDQFHLDGIFVNNITTVSGGWFSIRRECSAEVAAIRGNVNAADMPWRSVQY